jgi:hypothetical protein
LSKRGARLDARLRDESIDHLAGSQDTPAIRRDKRRSEARVRVIVLLGEHGNDYDTASSALKTDAVRHFGSWTSACRAAGITIP